MFGIGQTFLTVTPLQLAEVYAAIANNGKLFRPCLVSKITSSSGQLVTKFDPQLTVDLQLAPEIRSIVQQGLTEVIGDGGTASSAFQGFPIDKYPIAGKTGTAQKPPYDDSGIFACYAPANKPEIVVVVFLEQGGSGAGGAAPIARKILEAYFNLDQPQAVAPVATTKPVVKEQPSAGENSTPIKKPVTQEPTPTTKTPTTPVTGNGQDTSPAVVTPEVKPQTEPDKPATD